MRYRQLGNSGVAVSVVGLGCNRLGRQVDQVGANAIIQRALDMGINFLDTADVYGSHPGESETILGKALAGHWLRSAITQWANWRLHGFSPSRKSFRSFRARPIPTKAQKTRKRRNGN